MNQNPATGCTISAQEGNLKSMEMVKASDNS